MTSFWRIFWLEFTGFVRSKALSLLIAASVLWMFALPFVMKGDGTVDGGRELYVHYSLGGVFALLVVALLASATGSFAREREAKRLQLTLVRPVRYTLIVLGKILAHVAAGALVLAISCGVLAFKTDLWRPCNHVFSPILPTPREEAKAMYESYMKNPETPEAVKKTKKEIVLRLLENRAVDRYEAIATNACASWKFGGLEGLGGLGGLEGLAVRMRFTNQYEMRQDVRGTFTFCDYQGVVSNITQAVVTVPLIRKSSRTNVEMDLSSDQRINGPSDQGWMLSFLNEGTSALMLRPRKDINLLVPADAFGWNLVRAYVVLVAILAFVISLGTFLSAGLGRPVAMFVAFVMLIVSEMSPSVVEQYPDELETKLVDRIGLHITRFAAEMTRPVSAATPLEALAKDECVEPTAMLRLAVADLIAIPLLLSLLAALVLPRKQDY